MGAYLKAHPEVFANNVPDVIIIELPRATSHSPIDALKSQDKFVGKISGLVSKAAGGLKRRAQQRSTSHRNCGRHSLSLCTSSSSSSQASAVSSACRRRASSTMAQRLPVHREITAGPRALDTGTLLEPRMGLTQRAEQNPHLHESQRIQRWGVPFLELHILRTQTEQYDFL